MKKLGKLVLPSLLVALFFSGLSQPALGNSTATISVEPPIITVTVCTTFEVDIWIRNQGDMSNFVFAVMWDDTQMILDSYDKHLTEKGWGGSLAVGKGFFSLVASGYDYALDASWLTLSFHCINAGSSWIHLGLTEIWDGETPIEHTTVDGAVTQNPRYTPSYSSWVGGELTSVNKLAVLAPYLAIIGIAAAITVTYIVKRRRRA